MRFLIRFTPCHKTNFEVRCGVMVHANMDDPDALGIPWEVVNLACLNPWQWCAFESANAPS